MPVTMQNMAGELGLSVATVSSVVNGHARKYGIARSTEQRVREHLRRRGYIPSSQARDLRRRERPVVGVFYCGPLYHHLAHVFTSLSHSSINGGGGLEIRMVPVEHSEEALCELIGRGIQQLVWIHRSHVEEETTRAHALAPYLANVHTIVYNYQFESGADVVGEAPLLEAGIDLIGVDRGKDFRRLARELRKLGCRRIAVAAYDRQRRSARRLSAQAFAAAGLELVEIDCGPIADGFVGGSPKSGIGDRFLLDEYVRSRALHFARALAERCREQRIGVAAAIGDDFAAYALAELRRLGVHDCAVVCLAGLEGGALHSEVETALMIPYRRMAQRLHELLADGRSGSGRRCRFEMKMQGLDLLDPAPPETVSEGT